MPSKEILLGQATVADLEIASLGFPSKESAFQVP